MTLTKNENIDDEELNKTENEENTANEDNTDKKKPKAAEKKSDKKPKNEKLSDTDFLKGCLAQALEKSKQLADENDTIKKENEHLGELVEKAKEKLESLSSEYENYRRRTTLEKQSLGTETTCKAVKALLPALDNLERAMPFAESNPDSFKTGVGMTLNQLVDAFKSLGVEEIEAEGKEFDPNLHEVMMHEEDPEKGDSIITGVLQKGYKLGDKVIRHSAVKVVN